MTTASTRILRTMAVAIVALGAFTASASAALPRVTVEGSELRAGGKNFRSVGYNYSSKLLGTNAYNLEPTAENRAILVDDIADAKRLNANTLRIYLQVFDFVYREGGTLKVREDRLRNFTEILRIGDSMGVYFDVTGNLTWTKEDTPAWYDAMSNGERWNVQAFFWENVARVAAPYDSVFCYELQSEPSISPNANASWYGGELGGYWFVPLIARGVPAEQQALYARAWTTMMRNSVRKYDQRHLVTIGLLPIADWAFGPDNVGPLLDFLIVHEYPEGGGVNGGYNAAAVTKSLAIVKRFAAVGKPVVIGETAMMLDDRATQMTFMAYAQRYTSGIYTFFGGDRPDEMDDSTIGGALVKVSLQSFVDLTPWFLAATQLPEAFPIYRVTSNGHHFSTMNAGEYANVLKAGWKAVGTNGYAFTFQRSGTVPIYRMAGTRNGDHFYTTYASEMQSATKSGTYRSEGILGYAYPTAVAGTIPLYRLCNTKTGDHVYTVDAAERSSLLRTGRFRDEGRLVYVRQAA